MSEVMLTTTDNPYNPFKEWHSWIQYDMNVLRNNTCGLIARLARTNDGMSDYDNEKEIDIAIDKIFKLNLVPPSGSEYKLVSMDDAKSIDITDPSEGT